MDPPGSRLACCCWALPAFYDANLELTLPRISDSFPQPRSPCYQKATLESAPHTGKLGNVETFLKASTRL